MMTVPSHPEAADSGQKASMAGGRQDVLAVGRVVQEKARDSHPRQGFLLLRLGAQRGAVGQRQASVLEAQESCLSGPSVHFPAGPANGEGTEAAVPVDQTRGAPVLHSGPLAPWTWLLPASSSVSESINSPKTQRGLMAF